MSKIFSDGTGFNSYKDKYFKQTADIDLSAHYWYPIGLSDSMYTTNTDYSNFVANYDGDGFSVSGIRSMFDPSSLEAETYFSSITDNCALFGHVGNSNNSRKQKGSISNLSVKDSNITALDCAGIALMVYGEITNCQNYAVIEGYNEAAGICGEAGNAKISECANYGDIYNPYSAKIDGYGAAGILYGSLGEGSVEKCSNQGKVYSEYKAAAGIIATNYGLAIRNCYNTGYIELRTQLDLSTQRGGFESWGAAGISYRYMEGTLSESETASLNCYNAEEVVSNSHAGGVIGFASLGIKDCLNFGKITCGSNLLVGGVLISMGEDSILSNAYYGGNCENIGGMPTSSDVNGTDNSTYIADLDVKAKTRLFYSNNLTSFDFESTWIIKPEQNNGYPIFKTIDDIIADLMEFWFEKPEYYSTEFEGAGTKEEPYLISSAQQLAGLSYLVLTQNARYSDRYYLQTADIDLAGKNFFPIGSYIADSYGQFKMFSGHYDGGGYNIYNLTQQQKSFDPYVGIAPYGLKLKQFLKQNCGLVVDEGFIQMQMTGLFGLVSPANMEEPEDPEMRPTIKNINIINANTEGGYVGGVAGYAIYSDLDNCYYRGNLYSLMCLGGISAVAEGTNITNCVALGKRETGIGYTLPYGGIVMEMGSGKIQNCFDLGEIVGNNANWNYGGIVGATTSGDISIIKCKSVLTCKNANFSIFGGIVGQVDSDNIQILECLSEAQISDSAINCFGGIIGECWSEPGSIVYINKCFFGGRLNLTETPEVFGALIGKIHYDLSPNASMIDGCAAVIKVNNAAGESIPFEKFYKPSTAGYKISCINSFSLFTDSSTGSEVKINTLTQKHDSMDGVFVCSHIYDGAPVIAGMYYDSDYGTSTGIVQCLQTKFNVTIEEDSSSETTT